MMTNLLDSQIKAIKRRIRADDATAAEDAERLGEKYPDEWTVWQLLSYVRSRNKDYTGSIAAMNRILELLPPSPGIYCNRGTSEFYRGNLLAALADFTQGIAKCDELGDDYYRSALYFLRADVLIQLGRKAEARADLKHVKDGHTSWTTTLRSKDEMLSECNK